MVHVRGTVTPQSKNHATVSQAALSNFDRQITITHIRSHANEKSLVEAGTVERNDMLKRESRLTPEIWSSAFYPLRRARLSDWFLTRFVLSSDIAITIVFFLPLSFILALSLSFIFIFLPRKIYNRHAESSLEEERENTGESGKNQ